MSDLSFFAPGALPSAAASPKLVLDHYKAVLRAARDKPAERPRFRLGGAGEGFLLRAGDELAAQGQAGLVVVLEARDNADDDTEVEGEGAAVPALRRLIAKAKPGFAISIELSAGRPYSLPPPALDISTNDLCGLRCVMCSNRNPRRDPHTISADTVRELIDEAAAWGIRKVALTGAGEPFRDPELPAHIDHANLRGLLATVTTNGFPVSERLAGRLALAHLSVSVSIHGASDATHDAITGVPKSGEAAWRAVGRLVAARDREGARGRFSVNLSTVVQRQNVSEIAALVERGLAEGVDGHNLQPVNLQHGVIRGESIARRDDVNLLASLWPRPAQSDDLDRMLHALLALREAHPRHLHAAPDRLALLRSYLRDSSREALGVRCQVGERFLGVDHRGRLKPCYRLPWDLGDARLVRVRRLWNSLAYARVRRLVEACPLTCMNNCFHRA